MRIWGLGFREVFLLFFCIGVYVILPFETILGKYGSHRGGGRGTKPRRKTRVDYSGAFSFRTKGH